MGWAMLSERRNVALNAGANTTGKLRQGKPQRLRQNSKWPASNTSCSLWKEGTFLSFRVSLGARPASQHKGNLAHEIGNVVNYIECLAASIRSESAKEVPCWVDGPTQGHDD